MLVDKKFMYKFNKYTFKNVVSVRISDTKIHFSDCYHENSNFGVIVGNITFSKINYYAVVCFLQNYKTVQQYDTNDGVICSYCRDCLRRIAHNDDTEFSHQSILNMMEKFVKTVNKMDETILVPCRLMDQKVGDEHDPACIQNLKTKSIHSVHELFCSTDLFEIYNMLNGVKDGLLWGHSQESVPKTNITTPPVTKGHIRRPSTVSVASTNSSSSTLSDTDSESGSNENDSGIEEPPAPEECKVERVARDFRRHLLGLTNSLVQMTEAAQYLTWRYQYDIGSPV